MRMMHIWNLFASLAYLFQGDWCESRVLAKIARGTEEAERMQQMISDCTYAEIPGSDHMVYADNPDAFFPVFDGFLERVLRSK